MSTTSSWIDIWIKELECEARFAFPLIIKMQIKEVPYSRDVNVLTFSIFSLRYDKFSLSVKR